VDTRLADAEGVRNRLPGQASEAGPPDKGSFRPPDFTLQLSNGLQAIHRIIDLGDAPGRYGQAYNPL
jgi:hypothetical protein